MATNVPERGASVQAVGFRSKLQTYFRLHRQECSKSLFEFLKTPISSFLTLAVLGIALALPAGLHIVIKNSKNLSHGWEGTAQISLFLYDHVSEQAGREYADKLLLKDSIAEVEYISAAQALESFKQRSGYGAALDALDGDNPLPATIVILPSQIHSAGDAAEVLVNQLQDAAEVEQAQLDLQWLKRLQAIIAFSEHSVKLIAMLLGLAVLLIVSNTIRLAIQNRRVEIEVIKLVGATDGFIRRPFLYSGFWLGIFGGLFAWIIIGLALWWLAEPFYRLTGLYDSQFELAGLGFLGLLSMLALSALLGLMGSWLSVSRHLRDIKPQ